MFNLIVFFLQNITLSSSSPTSYQCKQGFIIFCWNYWRGHLTNIPKTTQPTVNLPSSLSLPHWKRFYENPKNIQNSLSGHSWSSGIRDQPHFLALSPQISLPRSICFNPISLYNISWIFLVHFHFQCLLQRKLSYNSVCKEIFIFRMFWGTKISLLRCLQDVHWQAESLPVTYWNFFLLLKHFFKLLSRINKIMKLGEPPQHT